jgi:hypothetical protein
MKGSICVSVCVEPLLEGLARVQERCMPFALRMCFFCTLVQQLSSCGLCGGSLLVPSIWAFSAH